MLLRPGATVVLAWQKFSMPQFLSFLKMAENKPVALLSFALLRPGVGQVQLSCACSFRSNTVGGKEHSSCRRYNILICSWNIHRGHSNQAGAIPVRHSDIDMSMVRPAVAA